MSNDLPPENELGKDIYTEAEYQALQSQPAGFNVLPAMDKPGPPAEEGAAERQLVYDSKQQAWLRSGGKWLPTFTERMVYVVVSAPGVFQIPRAWAFDAEEDAVAFRVKHLEDSQRRPGSLSPVFAVPVNNTAHSGYQEVDWSKYPRPKTEPKERKFM